MNMNQIHSFLAITKTLNFTAAARQLGIPQSTISRQINDLEEQLNVRLFYRTKRDVHLTDEGAAFLPYAREMADAAEKGTRSVRQLHDGNTGHLTIATVPAGEGVLCECLDRFHRDYPDIVVDIDRISAGFTLMDDMDSVNDFYFMYGDMLAAGDEYDSTLTHRESIGLVLSRELMDDMTSGDPSTLPEAIASSGIVLLSEETDPIVYMQTMNYCRTHRFTPRVTNTFSDPSSLLLALRSGMGVSFLPASLVREAHDGILKFVPLEDDSYHISCVAVWKKSLLNPAAGKFLDAIDGVIDRGSGSKG